MSFKAVKAFVKQCTWSAAPTLILIHFWKRVTETFIRLLMQPKHEKDAKLQFNYSMLKFSFAVYKPSFFFDDL